MKNKIRIYLSHPIRGYKRTNATDEYMIKNNQAAIHLGEELKAYFFDWYTQDGMPQIELYIPGEHDEFVLLAYQKGFLSETEILDVDCAIIDRCDILLAWKNPIHSNGMQREMKHAYNLGIPVLNFIILDNFVLSTIKRLVKEAACGV